MGRRRGRIGVGEDSECITRLWVSTLEYAEFERMVSEEPSCRNWRVASGDGGN